MKTKFCPICNLKMIKITSEATYCNPCILSHYDGTSGAAIGYQRRIGKYLIDWYDEENATRISYQEDFASIDDWPIICILKDTCLPLDIDEQTLKLYMTFL